MKRIGQIYIALLLVFSFAVFAQQKPVTTSIDKTKNKIGAQFNLTIKATADTNSVVTFPKGKAFGSLEIIRNYTVDTLKKGAQYELVKKYGLTQFDSGKYTIPPLKVVIGKKIVETDPIAVEVANVAVDTIKQKMYDIKDIAPAAAPMNLWWLYLILILFAIAGIGIGAYKLVKKKQQKKNLVEIFKSPLEKATTLLQQLEKKELWQKGEIKNYYSELTDIARAYIEEEIHIPAKESTTSELIAALRMAAVKQNITLSPETVENLEKVLRQADLVKFAKSKPLDFEIAEDRQKIEKTIVTLHDSIPEEVDDTSAFNEMQKQRMLKKQKQRRILISVGIVVFLLVATTLAFVAIKGIGFVKDNILGQPTKELLEGEWIKSEYGNPAISIETPKVLKRMDASKMPKEAMAIFKESQTFTYGTIFESFNITISTLTYKNETQIDLNKAQEGQLRSLEQQGAKNILLKQEQFDTKEGISGVKVYGTMTMKDNLKNVDTKRYYEALLFGQDNGLQQIVITHEDGDKYAEEIAKRVLESVELKKVTQ